MTGVGIKRRGRKRDVCADIDSVFRTRLRRGCPSPTLDYMWWLAFAQTHSHSLGWRWTECRCCLALLRHQMNLFTMTGNRLVRMELREMHGVICRPREDKGWFRSKFSLKYNVVKTQTAKQSLRHIGIVVPLGF